MKKIFLILLSLSCFCLFSYAHSADTVDNLPGFVRIPAGKNVNAFYMGKYPVTNAQYKEFAEDTGHKMPKYWQDGSFPEGKEKHPVIFVSYQDALDYCKWLETKYPEYSFRLPTKTEWEYAASGGRDYQFPWGNKADDSRFNYNKNVASVYLKKNPKVTYNNPKSSRYGETLPLNKVISINSGGRINGWIDHGNYTGFVYTDLFTQIMETGGYTTPVDHYDGGKSIFGVYDMSGNVWEWTSSLITASNGAEKGKSVYAIKGGSWYANQNSCKITMQGEGRRPNTGYNTVGFRVVAFDKSEDNSSYNDEAENSSGDIKKYSKKRKHPGSKPTRKTDKKPPLKPTGKWK